jgi:gluconolactonase
LLAVAPLVILPVYLNAAQPIRGFPEGVAAATIDLMTEAGLQQVQGQWRSRDVKVSPSDMRGITASSPHNPALIPRPNGLTLDPQGNLIVAQEGDHSIVRLGTDGSTSVVVNSYDGEPLNGPHGLVYRSDGTLYFTDPRTGLPKWFNPPPPSLACSGVYFFSMGRLQLLSNDLLYPFGIALSPDERYLYVVEHLKKKIMRYQANADGTVADGKIFFDLADLPGREHPCGLAVDEQGNLYVAGPGGVSVISPDGKGLGTILTPDKPRDLAGGDADNKSLYLSTPDGQYRLRSGIAGVKAPGTQP